MKKLGITLLVFVMIFSLASAKVGIQVGDNNTDAGIAIGLGEFDIVVGYQSYDEDWNSPISGAPEDTQMDINVAYYFGKLGPVDTGAFLDYVAFHDESLDSDDTAMTLGLSGRYSINSSVDLVGQVALYTSLGGDNGEGTSMGTTESQLALNVYLF